MDQQKSPLNPCSLESLLAPVEIDDNEKVWPVIVSCYELQSDGSRTGQMDLFSVQVPTPTLPTDKLQFGAPHTIESGQSGILDGKWFPKYATETKEWWYATARSSGELCIHTIRLSEDRNSSCPFHAMPFSARARLGENELESSANAAEELDSGEPTTGSTRALCLALNWDTPSETRSHGVTPRIVSSYSNGMVAIHSVTRGETENTPILMEQESWLAHKLFGDTPAEVWSCSFAAQGKIVISGGDDGKAKFWDASSIMRPMRVLQDFDAGVTAISPHPRKEHLVAMGSYDETIAIYDVRYATQTLLNRSEPLGGGIWRIQWHPTDDDRILVAAMHGGCRVIDLAWSDNYPSFQVVIGFTEHESMAYGADWLVHDQLEAAASCSFYDRAMFLWSTK
jgi:WD40 repeat protein